MYQVKIKAKSRVKQSAFFGRILVWFNYVHINHRVGLGSSQEISRLAINAMQNPLGNDNGNH